MIMNTFLYMCSERGKWPQQVLTRISLVASRPVVALQGWSCTICTHFKIGITFLIACYVSTMILLLISISHYMNGNCFASLQSTIPVLIKSFAASTFQCVAFPDDGATKRFSYMFRVLSTYVFSCVLFHINTMNVYRTLDWKWSLVGKLA